MRDGTDPAALAAISAAIDEATKAPSFAEIVQNAVKGDPINMGTEGTNQMMVDGLANAKILFAK